jgi:hypothetical protein
MKVTNALLEELGRALRTDDYGNTFWLDTAESCVTILTFDPEDGIDPPGEGPDWMRQERALAERILADPSRYRRVDGIGTPGRLHAFIRSVRDADLRDDLRDAARGRGAYRRVRDVLHRRGLEQLWYDFEAEADRELAREWLRSQGLRTPTDPDGPILR